MLRKLERYFLNKRLKSRLTEILNLIYSEKTWTTDEITQLQKSSAIIDKLQTYIGIQIASELKTPFTSQVIEKFRHKFEESLLLCSNSIEYEEKMLLLNKNLAQSTLDAFNAKMKFQRVLRDENKYSKPGIILSFMYAKGRPLTSEEIRNAENHYLNIKETTDSVTELEAKVATYLKQL